MSSSFVSVIIPAYNEEKHIGMCLESMIKQSFSPLEIIVVDDGSKDSTKDIVRLFPVILLEQKHQGPGKARNLASNNAKGEILVFMDADMTFDKDFIKDLVAQIIAKKFKGTFSKEEYVGNWDNVWSRCWNYNQNWPHKKLHSESLGDEGTDFRAILKSEFLKVDGFDDTGYTDTWSLLKKLGYRPHVAQGAKYFHNNPDSLGEVFGQSKWAAKREYKLGVTGKFLVLGRFFIITSILIGIYKSIKYLEPRFLIFKIVFDLGSFIGILEMIMTGKKSK